MLFHWLIFVGFVFVVLVIFLVARVCLLFVIGCSKYRLGFSLLCLVFLCLYCGWFCCAFVLVVVGVVLVRFAV